MYYSAIKPFDIANGPGIRVSLFVSGCPHHCKGCFNEETWNYTYGKQYSYDTKHEVIDLLKKDGIAGLTVLGGEPLAPENIATVADLITMAKVTVPDKTIWVYSGYTIEELALRWDHVFKTYSLVECVNTMGVLVHADVLVDGRFVEEKKDLKLRFRGSSNQRIIDLNKTKIRYPNTVADQVVIEQLVLAEEYM